MSANNENDGMSWGSVDRSGRLGQLGAYRNRGASRDGKPRRRLETSREVETVEVEIKLVVAEEACPAGITPQAGKSWESGLDTLYEGSHEPSRWMQ